MKNNNLQTFSQRRRFIFCRQQKRRESVSSKYLMNIVIRNQCQNATKNLRCFDAFNANLQFRFQQSTR